MTATPSETVRPEINAPVPINRMTTSELRKELSRAITMTADALSYLAACWVELERRGEDLSGLRVTLAPYLRAVASGTMAPEAVIAFAGRKMVLRWVGKQPIEIQRKLAADPRVTIEANGSERKVALNDLTAMELSLIRSDKVIGNLPERRRKKKPDSIRKQIGLYLSETEFKSIAAEANARGQTLSGYVRTLIGLTPMVSGHGD